MIQGCEVKIFSCFLVALLLCSPLETVKAKKIDTKKDEKQEDKKLPEKQINESEFQPLLLGTLLAKPEEYIGKKIKIRGKFSSFTTLALDYKEAMRASKDYISLCIFRPDSKIPLSELKLAYPVKEAKENQVIRELEEGDLIEIYGEGFSAALSEPWVDILAIKKIENDKFNQETSKLSKDKEKKK
ncbi:MAG: hypothetical protein HYY52_02335 [Candidatus Melainabacteria bacterium]|nr:hypothetical protein [Candidatus Melainabacteria bacterium]